MAKDTSYSPSKEVKITLPLASTKSVPLSITGSTLSASRGEGPYMAYSPGTRRCDLCWPFHFVVECFLLLPSSHFYVVVPAHSWNLLTLFRPPYEPIPTKPRSASISLPGEAHANNSPQRRRATQASSPAVHQQRVTSTNR